jgi:hypothetical protein
MKTDELTNDSADIPATQARHKVVSGGQIITCRESSLNSSHEGAKSNNSKITTEAILEPDSDRILSVRRQRIDELEKTSLPIVDSSEKSAKHDDVTSSSHMQDVEKEALFQKLNELLLNYAETANEPAHQLAIDFSTWVLESINPNKYVKLMQHNVPLREALHGVLVKIEDALDEAHCINRVGDLLPDKQVRAKRLTEAAKAAKEAGMKFDPSPFLPGYEPYCRKKHGDPVDYLKKWFGEFLASCNEEKVDYLWRGDIYWIDPALRGALYRKHRATFERLVQVAGKKSTKEINALTDRGKKKFKEIIALSNSHLR